VSAISAKTIPTTAAPIPRRAVTAPPVASAPAGRHASTGAATTDGDAEARGFGWAIVVGILIGIPAMTALVAVMVKWAMPTTDTVSIIATAVWVAIFCGPFMAGTVTVGLWARRAGGH
jgi:hypothetical protein